MSARPEVLDPIPVGLHRRPVLEALPTSRPACADDSEERTQFFRPNQKRPTWKDVERARAAAPVRQAPALQLVPRPDTRGSHHAPAAKHVSPYLKPGYWRRDWLSSSAPLGEKCHDAMRAEMGKAAHIRQTPKSLAALLRTPEWAGSTLVWLENMPGWVEVRHPIGAVARINAEAL